LREGRYSGDSVVWAWWWWLRSPGNNSNNAANVNTDGNVNVNGNNVSGSGVGGGVRPALPHMPDIRFKVERIRAEAKESDSLLTRLGRKTQVGGSRDADKMFVFMLYGSGNRLCHSRRQ
jgi:hypothetical protein